jgi:tyrosyl-tRNA synthetase
MPILPGTDGVKRMSKSEGNYIGITEPPEEIFGKLMRIPDAAMPVYYDLLLDRPFEPEAAAVDSKRSLARGIVATFHDAEAAERAEAAFDRLHVAHELPDEVAEADLPAGDSVHLPALIAEGFGLSRSEARRLLQGGGVKLDGRPLGEDELDIDSDRLDGAVVQLGKRRFLRFRRAA